MSSARERYIERWRAEMVALALWRQFQGLRRWETVGQKPSYIGDRHTQENPTGGPDTPAMMRIKIEPVSEIGIEEHEVRLWRTDYEAARAEMTAHESNALDVWLLKRTYSAVFGVHRTKGQIRRIEPAPLAEAIRLVAERVEVVDG